jgi:regulator of sirC expression with transglutaminase-like and TPR domain
MTVLPPFAEVAAHPDAALDVIALALASEFGPVDAGVALQTLDAFGEQLKRMTQGAQTSPDAEAEVRACAQLLAGTHGFTGNREHYDDPSNSMLDLVLKARRGLPILLCIVYVEAARRAGIPLGGVGLGGHFVGGHFGADPPLLLDPFADGARVDSDPPDAITQAWPNHEIAMRMLNNLFGSYQRRGDYNAAIRAAEMRLVLPAPPALSDTLRRELLALQARLN